MRRYERDAADLQRVNKEAEEREALKKVEKFERVEMTIPQAKTTQKEAKIDEIIDEKQREKVKYVQKLLEDKTKQGTLIEERDEEKKEWIKTSFWAPDNTPLVKPTELKPPSKDLYCPAVPSDDKLAHTLRLKDLIAL